MKFVYLMWLFLLGPALGASDLVLPEAPPRPTWWAASVAAPEPWSFSDFRVLGPFPYTKDDVLAEPIGAEGTYDADAKDPRGQGWSERPLWRAGMPLLLHEDFGECPNSAAFITCRLVLTEACLIRLVVHSDDISACWVNGERVTYKRLFGAMAYTFASADLPLAAGEHRVVIKVVQAILEWGVLLRAEDAENASVHGRIRALEERVAAREIDTLQRRTLHRLLAWLYVRCDEPDWAIHHQLQCLQGDPPPHLDDIKFAGVMLSTLGKQLHGESSFTNQALALFTQRYFLPLQKLTDAHNTILDVFTARAALIIAGVEAGGTQRQAALAELAGYAAMPLDAAYARRVAALQEATWAHGADMPTTSTMYRTACGCFTNLPQAVIAAFRLARLASQAGHHDEAIVHLQFILAFSRDRQDLEVAFQTLQLAWIASRGDPLKLLRFLDHYRGIEAPAGAEGRLLASTPPAIHDQLAASLVGQHDPLLRAAAAVLEQRDAEAVALVDEPVMKRLLAQAQRLSLVANTEPALLTIVDQARLEALRALVIQVSEGAARRYVIDTVATPWQSPALVLAVLVQRARDACLGGRPEQAVVAALVVMTASRQPEVAIPAMRELEQAWRVADLDPHALRRYLGAYRHRQAQAQAAALALPALHNAALRAEAIADLDRLRQHGQAVLLENESPDLLGPLDHTRLLLFRQAIRTEPLRTAALCDEALDEVWDDRKPILEELLGSFVIADMNVDGSQYRRAALAAAAWLRARSAATINDTDDVDLVRILDKKGEHEAALALIDAQAQRHLPAEQLGEMQLLRATQFAHLGQHDEALAAIAPLLTEPTSPKLQMRARYLAGWMCAIAGQMDAAGLHLRRLIAEHADNPEAATKAAALLQRLGLPLVAP